MLTADAPRAGRRERDLRTGFAVPADVTVPAVDAAIGGGRPITTTQLFELVDATLDWDDLAALAADCSLPVLLKGVQTGRGRGARRRARGGGGDRLQPRRPPARRCGRDSLDILPEVVEAVGERCEVLMDGGVRRGTDVAVALALGARAVLVGPRAALGAGGRRRGGGPPGARAAARGDRARAGAARLRFTGGDHVSARGLPGRIFGIDGGTTPSRGGPAPGPRARGAVRCGLRQRRLVDLLRARAGRALRARADPDHVHDRRA